ncbi:adhesion G -coupled receptor E3-like protein [Labeo rohita]|uniref:Adhesion G-coupled receptor E3-like protein n=1 Tax=Labeo rohita TaxID=84645 RepID=A0A498M8C9_LABRO|nr:adhesion G -coupled receptor E3-like protein [Labeo rohita]
MYCNTTMHHFYYQRDQNQHQYHCMGNDCICVGNKDTCTCYSNTSSCFCETLSNNITVPTAVRPVHDCVRYNNLYICTGTQYHLYCDTAVNDFSYYKYQYQNQYQYNCWGNNCYCSFNKDSCWCWYSHSSSCFCTNFSNITTIPAGVSPVYDCGIYNNTYICTGAQYRMYCNTRMHSFYYWRSRNQNQHQYECWDNNCYCTGNKDTCTCYSSTLSSCFCENYGNTITIPAAVSLVTDSDCLLYNNTYICTGAQYRMYCNTQMHNFNYQRYQYKYQYQCANNNCNCIGNKDTCTCYSTTLSSCFCETYGNSLALSTAVNKVFDCVLNDTSYICTGAQYRMYCNTRMHYFYYWRSRNQNQYQYQCWNNNCYCIGNKDTCTCYGSTLSSCFCETYGNSIALTSAVRPAYGCELYNDTYICTGAQYRMYCNTTVHDFNYWRYQNQNQYQYQCVNNNCYCIGNKDTCTCYRSILSTCFCETYSSNLTIPTAVNPLKVPQCMLLNETYICTGAQYRMHCNTSMNYFYYRRYRNQNQNQDQYQCTNNCYCIGDKDTCTCYGSTLSSCFCETYGNSIALTSAVRPAYGCELYNDIYICTGAQYRMYCNTTVHDFYYWRYQNQNQYQYQCVNNNCYCIGNKDTCTCYGSVLSSCFCETYGNITALTAAVNPVYDCVLFDTLYICTGAQYQMYCNTSVHDFYYSRYHYSCYSGNCDCTGNKDTCTCYSSTSSSCFCTNSSNSIITPAAVSPVYECGLYNDTYICTGAQYRMYCNTRMHYFNYWRYRNQNQYQLGCWNYNCYCFGNKDTCTCYRSTLSSCFCESNNFTATLTSQPTAGVNITLLDQCMSQTPGGCLQNLSGQIENITAKVLPLDSNCNYLINKLDCDKHFDCGLRHFRGDFRVIIISKPN